MIRFFCTIFNEMYFVLDHETLPRSPYFPAYWIASRAVQARNAREAAAKAYVRTVGRPRARKFKELNAPGFCILLESNWMSLAHGLGKASNRIGNCFVYHTLANAFYIRVERLPASPRNAVRRRARRRRQLVRVLGSPSVN